MKLTRFTLNTVDDHSITSFIVFRRQYYNFMQCARWSFDYHLPQLL